MWQRSTLEQKFSLIVGIKPPLLLATPQINFHFLLNSIIYLICLICYLYVLPIVDLVYVCLSSKLPEDWLKNHETLCSSDLNKLSFLFNIDIDVE